MNRTLQFFVISILAASFSEVAVAQCCNTGCFGWPSNSGGSGYYYAPANNNYQPAWRPRLFRPAQPQFQYAPGCNPNMAMPYNSPMMGQDGMIIQQYGGAPGMVIQNGIPQDGIPQNGMPMNDVQNNQPVPVPEYAPAATTDDTDSNIDPALVPPTPADDQDEVVLFDGSDLNQWRGYAKEEIGQGWKIDDGILKFDGSGGGDIITKETFENFEFAFEWAVTEAANSGIMYRVGLGDSAPYLTGPEYQILDDAKHRDGQSPLTSAASLYGLFDRGNTQTKPVGQWNTGKIVINNNKVQHWLNGELAVETVIGGDEWKEKVAASKFKDWAKFGVNSSGHLCLQDHGDEVWYRNLKVTRLPGN